ncbi:GDSL esterase/lipase EXL3-like [Malania oleifera]|uniref:GDSL esterase/lipase EXL3-like n=1 Tax=Malania oleifera TaxID=397392 RepID=UPI0025AECB3D|nr:GDSL esterase/lipase EXL3-like [Malania oleifera]
MIIMYIYMKNILKNMQKTTHPYSSSSSSLTNIVSVAFCALVFLCVHINDYSVAAAAAVSGSGSSSSNSNISSRSHEEGNIGYYNSASRSVEEHESVPAMIVFGDSIVDPGNNNNLKTLIKCNFPPYGRDFMGGLPTGRFSNGKVPSDLLAQSFGVKEFLPAYLDPNLQVEDLITGVSFASGGAGFDPLTARIVSVLSLSDQLELFKEYMEKLKAAVGEERTETIISKSIYIVCAGSDDIANTYYSTPYRSQYDLPSYTDLMLNSALSFVQELYGMGGRRIGVFSAPPIGCVPSQRTTAGGIGRECVENRNQAALLFNSKLSSQLSALASTLSPETRLVYLDVYSPLFAIIQNPSLNGFKVASKGCCGTGTIEVTLLCTRYSLGTCTDVSDYIFWDSYHPTEAAYRTLVRLVYQKYAAKFF